MRLQLLLILEPQHPSDVRNRDSDFAIPLCGITVTDPQSACILTAGGISPPVRTVKEKPHRKMRSSFVHWNQCSTEYFKNHYRDFPIKNGTVFHVPNILTRCSTILSHV